MNGHSVVPSYLERLEAFRRSDAERDSLVAELLRGNEELQIKYTEKCDDYNDAVHSRRMWQSKASLVERQLSELVQASGSNPFALAIIDGDGAVFQDYLYAMGKDGGADAAHQLHTELRNNLRATYPDSNVTDWNIVVQVILNLQGLATKLQASNIITHYNELFAFGRAFGMAQPLFCFIDVGGGKERADYKVRETLRLFLPIVNCRHIWFGPCHDNGYLPALEPYKRDSNVASRFTLIETRPAEPGFLSLGFNRVQFPRIFRLDNLPTKPTVAPLIHTQSFPVRATSNTNVNTATLVPNKSTSPAPSNESTSSSTWATVGKAGTASKNISIAPSKKAAPRKHILLNVHDERIDVDLPRTDSGAEHRFAERVKAKGKCCKSARSVQIEINASNRSDTLTPFFRSGNSFHLGGCCDAKEYCDYIHGERLTPGEQLVLKHKAKSLCCPNRENCRDMNCFLGHHCKFATSCLYDVCRFSDTHGMELVKLTA